MKSKGLIFLLAFILVITAAIGAEKIRTSSIESTSEESATPTKQEAESIPQLENEGREQSATMVLLGAPPMQPTDHIDRWNPDLHAESCMTCHAVPATGAPTPPANHYYDDVVGGTIFRDNCIQCHGEQNDTKAAFNDEE